MNSLFFFPFFLFPLLVVSGKNRQPEGNFESVSSICSWISCFGESVRAGVPSVFGIKNSKVRWIAATSADFCPRGGERTVIMYLWVSINHFRSPDRRGYRPLACGLKSYRFLARSIRCPRPGDIFLSSFFLFSPGFCRFFDGPLLVTVYGSEENVRLLKKKVIEGFLSPDWLFRSEI